MSAGVRYHIIGPEADAVAHVLTTARACAAKWRTWSYPHMPSECRDLVDAVDVLDEPRERYTRKGSHVLDRGRVMGQAINPEDAEKIVTALNASEAQS